MLTGHRLPPPGFSPAQVREFSAALAAGTTGVPHPPHRRRALAEFPGGEDGFRDWLLHEALATKLESPAVACFRPAILKQAREKLSAPARGSWRRARPRKVGCGGRWRSAVDFASSAASPAFVFQADAGEPVGRDQPVPNTPQAAHRDAGRGG